MLLGVAFAFVALVSFPSWAAGPGPSITDFQHTTWTAKDGVLADTWAIAQTTDGWLWFGGPNGLTRFDGLSFEKVAVLANDSRLSNGIRALYATPSGSLLIAHLTGGVSILEAGGLNQFDTEETRRAGAVREFTQDAEGTVWATAENGLLRFDGKLWTIVGRDWSFPGGSTYGTLADAHGTVWVSTPHEVLRLPNRSHSFERIERVAGGVGGFIQSPDGLIWLVTDNGMHPLPAQGKAVRRDPSINSRTSYVALFDQRGLFWEWWFVEAGLSPPGPSVRDVASLGMVKTILEDREGNIWLGDQIASIHRLRWPTIVRLSNSPATLVGTPWTSLAVDKIGNLWMAMQDGPAYGNAVDGVWQLDPSGLQHVQADEITTASVITKDARGEIWVGGREGVWKLEEGGHFVKALDLPSGQAITRVVGLTGNCSDGLWLSLKGIGLLRHDGVAWKSNGNVSQLPAATPTAQACDLMGHLWLGYGDGTLARVDDGRAKIFSGAHGPRVGPVSAISAGRHTLVAGERGLALFIDGTFQNLKAGFPAFESVTGIIESSNGDTWVNGMRGLAHIEATAIDLAISSGAFDVATELFDGNDGYPEPAFSAVGIGTTSLAQAGDGRIWFAAHGGIASIDPEQAQRSVVPTPLVIRSLSLGGHVHELARRLTLPKDTRNLEIGYAALNYSHPERLRFRYRLDGSDAAWVDADTRRRAFYTNLGPGTYRFVVNVTNENGLWSDTSASLDFVIPPTFVQSRAFLALCIAGAIALLTLAYRARVRQIEASQRALLDERLGERERIARELHDTLLQGTQALILRVHAATRDVPEGNPARVGLGEAMSIAEKVLSEGRDRIQDLRGNDDALHDPAEALRRFGTELSLRSETQCSLVVEGRPRALQRSVAEAIYLIGREALSNAFRHAHAQSVEAQIIYGDTDFRLRVRDDGVGIDPDVVASRATPGHWGLKGMTERAQKVGACLDMWSRAEAGMELELTVPAPMAYCELQVRKSWLQRLRQSLTSD